MKNTLPVHDFSINHKGETLFEIFQYNPLTVITPILEANFSPHRHKFYELIYLTAGSGKHVIDFTAYECKPPMLFFVSPGQIHFWDITEKKEGYVFLFKEDFLLSSSPGGGYREFTFFHSMMESPFKLLTGEQVAILQPLIAAMLKEIRIEGGAQESVLQAYFHILLVTIQRMCLDKADLLPEYSLVKRFKKLVSNNINCNLDVQGSAIQLGVSEAHLRNIIKEKTGKSPGQIIRQEVAMEAKRLLIHTDLNASEVGYRLGFEDPSYFGRYFKRECGLSPSSFRNKIIEKYQFKGT